MKINEISKKIKRDNGLKERIFMVVFSFCFISILFNFIKIGGDFLNHYITYAQFGYSLKLLLENLVLLIFLILSVIVTPQKLFNNKNYLIISSIITVYIGFTFYKSGYPLNKNFIMILVISLLVLFLLLKKIFSSVKNNLEYINPSYDDYDK